MIATARCTFAESHTDAVTIEEYKGFKIAIVPDSDPMDVRDNDGNACMITWDRDYSSPDSNDYGWGRHDQGGSFDFMDWLKERKTERHSTDPGLVYAWLDRDGYDGSLSICQPDEGNAREMHRVDGVIYATYDMIREWQGTKRLTVAQKRQARDGLRDEVKVYSLWATGQVYGYVVGDDEDDHIDSCWGFISIDPSGDDYAMQEGKEAVDALINSGREPVNTAEDDTEEIDQY